MDRNNYVEDLKKTINDYFITQAKFAKFVGISPSTISRIIKGESVPSDDIINVIYNKLLLMENFPATMIEKLKPDIIDEDAIKKNEINEWIQNLTIFINNAEKYFDEQSPFYIFKLFNAICADIDNLQHSLAAYDDSYDFYKKIDYLVERYKYYILSYSRHNKYFNLEYLKPYKLDPSFIPFTYKIGSVENKYDGSVVMQNLSFIPDIKNNEMLFLIKIKEGALDINEIYLCKNELNESYLLKMVNKKDGGISYVTTNSFDGDPTSPIQIPVKKMGITECYKIISINSIM